MSAPTAPLDAVDAPRVGLLNAVFRGVAESLGWTPGQAWTVAIGLAVAVPAALFGLGPTMATLRHPSRALAVPPAAAAEATPAPAQPPAILANRPVSPTAPGARPSSGGGRTTPSTGAPPVSSSVSPTVDDSVLASIDGPGTVRSVAVAADAVVVAVDAGAGAPGRVVVLDGSGAVVRDASLVVNGVPYQQPGGVAVTGNGVLVTTTSPAAVLRVDPGSGTVAKVADIPDVPLCLPVVRATDCQAAVPDSAPRPEQLATAASGDVFVADRGQACLFRIVPGETAAKAWLCDLSFAPLPAASDGGLAGLAVAGDEVLFTVASGFDGTDSIQAVRVADGAPVDRHQVAASPNQSGTAGLTVLPDGRIVAALTNANALFVVAADGSSSQKVDLAGITGPVDVDVRGDDLVIAHHADGIAGRLSKRPISSLH